MVWQSIIWEKRNAMAMLTDITKKDKNPVQRMTTGFLPAKITIPLCQEDGFECTSSVKPGDSVREGQVIADVSRDEYGSKSFGAAKIHSPIPGTVTEIKSCTYPNGKQGKAVEIFLNGSFTYLGKQQTVFDWKNYSPAMLLRTISEGGVINTFSNSSYSSFEIEMNKIKDEKDKKLVVRLFDEDPSCQADSILTRSEFEKIATGIYISAKVLDANEIIIAYAKNAKLPAAVDIETKELFGSIPVTFIEIDTRFYPCGGKRELIKAWQKQRRVAVSDKEMLRTCFFTDSTTMFHVYNAVVLNIPVETVNVFVTGDCLQANALLKVCVGTSFKTIAKQCGGFTKKLGKIIVNGQISGVAINSLDTPVTKYVKSISFNSRQDNYDRSVGVCLRCGRCRSVCSLDLSPNIIYAKKINNAQVDPIYLESAMLCTECGLCSAICPSKLPLTHVIRLLKEESKENVK